MINLNLTDDRICGTFIKVEEGKQSTQNFDITYSEETYKKMKSIYDALQIASSMDTVKQLLKDFETLTNEDQNDLLYSVTDSIYRDRKTGLCYLQMGGVRSSIPMPTTLSNWIFERLDKKDEIDPIVKFWIRLLRNPNIRTGKQASHFAELLCNYVTQTYVDQNAKAEYMEAGMSEEVATERATVPQTPLTKSGLISTKKVVQPLEGRMQYKYEWDDEAGAMRRTLRDDYKRVVNEDTGEMTIEKDGELFNEDWIFEPYIMGRGGDAFHCGQAPADHVIRVGQEMWLDDWSQVNCNNNQACVPGIHTGNYGYIDGYEREDNITLNCFVCPSQVGAVACRDNVLRVKSLFPHSIMNREMANKSFYSESYYADMCDEKWDEERLAVIEKYESKIIDIKKEIDEIASI